MIVFLLILNDEIKMPMFRLQVLFTTCLTPKTKLENIELKLIEIKIENVIKLKLNK